MKFLPNVLCVLSMLTENGSAFVPSAPNKSSMRDEESYGSRQPTSRLYVDGQGMAGGSRHLLGDIIRSLQPEYLKQVADSVKSNAQGMPPVNVDAFCGALEEQASIGSWQQLAGKLPTTTTTTTNIKVNNKPSAKATTRLFGQKKPVVTLYRDSAAWCPYCQKVWLALEEKQVPYEVIKIDMRCYGKGKPSEFLSLQPSGNLPCAIVNKNHQDGQQPQVTIGESNDIMDALDELAGKNNNTPVLRPAGKEELIRDLCDNGRESLERRLYARWMWWLTGVRRPEEYKTLFLEHWQEMDDALGGSSGPYFLGKEISVVDLRFIPFVERQLASLVYYKGATYLRDATKYPNVVRWLEAMESRPSYQASKSDYYTHSRALPPQLSAGCSSEPGCEAMQEAIDSYPVGNGSSDWEEPGWSWSVNPAQEAAQALVTGADKIVAFSARGAGVAGFPAASAPLADPAATPNEAIMPALDLVLRSIAMSLLQPKNRWLPNNDRNNESTLAKAVPLLDDVSAGLLADCLDYLRARIGVPRDMSYPAAQALRQEILSMSEMLRGVKNSGKGTEQSVLESVATN